MSRPVSGGRDCRILVSPPAMRRAGPEAGKGRTAGTERPGSVFMSRAETPPWDRSKRNGPPASADGPFLLWTECVYFFSS